MLTTRTIRSAPDAAPLFPEGNGAPALLVSVRDPAEALAALEGGAQVVDAKEPGRGPLGAPDRETLEAIVHSVAGRAPVTAAWGELSEHAGPSGVVAGIAAYKLGLGKAPRDWVDRLNEWRERLPSGVLVVPAAYWDHLAAEAPPPEAVLAAASRLDGWMVLDTWDKSAGPLPIEAPRLSLLMQAAQQVGVRIALAGGLTQELLPRAAGLGPALLGVRGAACAEGRESPLDPARVRKLRESVSRTKPHGLP